MAQLIPKLPAEGTKSRGERELFSCLAKMPDTGDRIILHSVQIANHATKTQGEADFVVLIPDGGIFTVEVKGGKISFINGEWRTENRYGREESLKSSPVAQATEEMNSLKVFIESHITENKYLWGWCVAFPDCFFHENPAPPDLADSLVIDTMDKADLRGYFLRLSDYWRQKCAAAGLKKRVPSAEECRRLRDLLRPNINYSVSITGQVKTIGRQLVELTENQNDVMEGLFENDRCLIRGEAGTGKTIIAMNFYKMRVDNGAKCAYFCYNRELACHVRRAVGADTECCFHAYLESVVKSAYPQIEEEKEKDKEAYYTKILPSRFNSLPQGSYEQVDYLIVDEAQDLVTEEYIGVFDRLLYGGLEKGRWMLFIDADRQSTYTHMTYEDVYNVLAYYCSYYTKYTLKDNCRNSAAIVETLNRWFGLQIRCRNRLERGVDVAVRTYRRSEEETQELEKILDELSGKFPPSDIVLLSRNRLENSAAAGIKKHKISSRREKDSIYFSTIQAFKGLESPIVVLCVFSDLSEENERNRQYLYVGMTRAKSLLYIVMQKRAYTQLKNGG